jgi:hypothetical protein
MFGVKKDVSVVRKKLEDASPIFEKKSWGVTNGEKTPFLGYF